MNSEAKATTAQERYYDTLCEELFTHETDDFAMEKVLSDIVADNNITKKAGMYGAIQGLIKALTPYRRAEVRKRTEGAKVKESNRPSSLDKVGKVFDLNGVYYTVRVNTAGTHAYAMEWDTESRRYVYAPGMINLVTNNGTQLDVDRVASIGLDTKHCMSCGKPLTNAVSRDLGIGPVCRRRY